MHTICLEDVSKAELKLTSTTLPNMSPNPANCSSPKRAESMLTNKENAKRFSDDRSKVSAVLQQRRALR